MRSIIFILLFFLAQVLSAYQMLPLHSGWQSIAISGQMNSLNDFNGSAIDIIWSYKDGKWSAYSNNTAIKTALQDYQIPTLNSISPNSAVWIKANKSGILTIDVNRSTEPMTLHTNWQLIGSDIGWEDMSEFNSSKIESVWLYDGMHKSWRAYSPDTIIASKIISANITSLKRVPPNRGVWVKAKDDISLNPFTIKDINSTASETNPTSEAYDYNKDMTAFLKIKQQVCNDWQNALSDINDTNISDMQNIVEAYKAYLSNALEKDPAQNELIYAPRGNAGEFEVNVTNGQIDLSNYKLPGDLNGDGNVSQEDADMLINALAMKSIIQPNVEQYDLDKDGVVDVRDLLYLGARLLTQVKYFDFYTIDGTSLGLPSLAYEDRYTPIDINSSVSTVRVVARDENGASSSKDEKITANEWYKDYKVLGKKLAKTYTCPVAPEEFLSLFATAEGKYVVGFMGSVSFISGHLANKQGIIEDTLVGCFPDIIYMYLTSKTHKYFVPTDMGYNVKFGGNKITLAMVDGYRLSSDDIKDIKTYNAKTAALQYEVHAKNKKVMSRFLHNGKYINVYAMLRLNAVFRESLKKFSMKGKITRNTQDKYQDCGKIRYDRFGPASQKDSEKTNLLNDTAPSTTKYNFSPILSMGHYHASIVWPKGSERVLDSNFIVKQENDTKDFHIPLSKGDITGHLYTFNNKPLKNKEITIRSTCDDSYTKEVQTDGQGYFKFEEMEIGEYEIVLDNEPKAVVYQPGGGTTKDIKDKPYWKITIKYSSINPFGSGTLSVKRFKLDCENATDDGSGYLLGKVCTEIHDDGTVIDNIENDDDKAKITYSGKLINDPNLNVPLIITTYGVAFNAAIKTAKELQPEQIHSFTTKQSSFNSVYACRGVFPDIDNALKLIKENGKIHFKTFGNSTCEFTLEPCKNDSCEDESSLRYDDFDADL